MAQERGVEFEACIVSAANVPVGNYNITEHKVCQGLWHGRLNHVFELAGVLCQSRLEFMVQKWKPAGAMPTLAQKGALGKWRRPRVSSHFGTQTSALELKLAKPVRPSKKFIAQASGLVLLRSLLRRESQFLGKRCLLPLWVGVMLCDTSNVTVVATMRKKYLTM
jgi:hypothetical protein